MTVNRPAAGTIIGTQSVARAAPDGHTVVLVSVPHVASYTLYREMKRLSGCRAFAVCQEWNRLERKVGAQGWAIL